MSFILSNIICPAVAVAFACHERRQGGQLALKSKCPGFFDAMSKNLRSFGENERKTLTIIQQFQQKMKEKAAKHFFPQFS